MMKLKLCPFCGGEAKVYKSYNGKFYIECRECDPMKYMRDNQEETIYAWNHRVEG